MLFNFKLRPVQDIVPWERDGKYTLSWFGLTDGWYWMDCRGQELFRYTDSAIQTFKRLGFQVSDFPYTDYQVVRLWEDILGIFPDVLEPIPAEVLRKIKPGQVASCWDQQLAELIFTEEREVSKLEETKYESATDWLKLRRLYTSYLNQRPGIWLWSDGKQVFIRWNCTGLTTDDHEVWTAQAGTYSLPVEAFIEEVRSFNQRLMTEMNDRVQQIQQKWDRPEIEIDKKQLVYEQSERAQWFNEALQRSKGVVRTNWTDVIEAISSFEKAHLIPSDSKL
jgi:hypothetical protein